MKIRDLKRVTEIPALGIFGVFLHEGIPLCLSVEAPWRDNIKFISAIPSGSYLAHPVTREDWGDCYRVSDDQGNFSFKGRDGLYIHPVNKPVDLKGCIGPGTSFDPLDAVPAVLNSRKALDEIINLTDFSVFKLFIWGYQV